MDKLRRYATGAYWIASDEEKERVCNGCGAEGGIKFPNTMYGLDISEGCDIHDYMFFEGKTLGDFYFANMVFIWNLFVIIIKGPNVIMVMPRLYRAAGYALAVIKLGSGAYWIDKTFNDELNVSYRGEFKKWNT